MINYAELLQGRKTPFYVFDEEGFIENYRNLERSMKDVYPNYRVSYSYKTNYTPYICELVKCLGGYAEVVSDMEYALAKRIGYENNMIVYNGPSKGEFLEEHLLNGGIVNIDNIYEAKRIAQFAKKHPEKQFELGLRINLNFNESFISRFGMEVGSEDLEQAVDYLNNEGNIHIVGLHCHVSRNRSLEAWKKRAEIMLDAAEKYVSGQPKYISLGSGMFADMADELKIQFTDVPSYCEYARATMQPFADRYGKDGPIIFTEPGTTVVARYIVFVSKVLNFKRIQNRYMATMDGSFENLGEICTMKKLPLRKIFNGESGMYYDCVDFMGYTCLEQDLMYAGFAGEIGVGDVFVFENVGGYSIVSKPQFIRPNCSMIVRHLDGSISEIMREETFEDVFSKYKFGV